MRGSARFQKRYWSIKGRIFVKIAQRIGIFWFKICTDCTKRFSCPTSQKFCTFGFCNKYTKKRSFFLEKFVKPAQRILGRRGKEAGKNVQKENEGHVGKFVIDRQEDGMEAEDYLLKVHRNKGDFGWDEGVCRSSFVDVARHLKNRTGMWLYIWRTSWRKEQRF